MNDVLPEEIGRWQRVEQIYARTMSLYGYREVRTPLVESTGLFSRAIGEATDVVEKEMYSFEHHEEPLTLRPEGTAGAARAYIEHSIHAKEGVTRWWYGGAMFRAERPQRGRYRQFYQRGAERFGDPGPGCDAEMIDMLVQFLRELAIPDLQVLVNTLGGPKTRETYRDALVLYLTPKLAMLSEDSQRRLQTNPLRILDSKKDGDREAVKGAPTLQEFLSEEDRAHFDSVRRHLDALGTPYTVEDRLVRGLDYYTRTLFEIVGAREKLGAGSTLVGGGRYDFMVAGLGGPQVPAIGYAAGLERLLIASELTIPDRKRLEVAKALALDPEVLLLDEVMAGLNATEVDEALDLLRAVNARGVTLIVVEHLMKAIVSISTTVVVLAEGEKIAEGAPAEVLASPRGIEAYLGARYAKRLQNPGAPE